MGDRHGGRFARRGRALSPPHPQVDAHRAVGFRWRATVFRWRGVVGRICPAQKRSPRRRPPDTAHERKDLPSGVRVRSTCRRTAGRPRPTNSRKNTPSAGSHPRPRTGERICPRRNAPSAKASRHGARAKGFAPRRNAPLRRSPPDTAHRRKNLPRAGALPTAKVSRHGARAKGFAPRGSCSPHVLTNGGPLPTDGLPEKHPFGGVAPETARPLPSSFTEKK